MNKPGEVRIIGGVWRRSKLPVLALPGLRPSGDRLRETLFNWLPHDLSGWRVLDAFAGSGALGKAAASLKQVVAKLQGAAERVTVTAGDGFAALAGRWDLVLIDPPFEANWFAKALDAAAGAGWIYLEAPSAFDAPPGYRLHRHLKAGAVHAHLFCRDT